MLSQAERLEQLDPQDIVTFAIKSHSPDIAIAFSSAEDVVLIDMAAKSGFSCRVFALDTDRLHPETYEFFDLIRVHYKLNLEIFFPQPEMVESLVRENGLFSFYRDGHGECCGIRKVEPLRRALAPLNAWITAQRRAQNPSTRSRIPVMQLDPTLESEGDQLVKFNPLANWVSAQVLGYTRKHNVPHNPLHECGFVSIGCQPCTRPVLPGQPEREGRWWWEEETKKECGLHQGNLRPQR